MKKETINGEVVRIQVWDTGGQERFRTITKSYYERAMGVLLVYDCGDERSFNETRSWIKQIDAHATNCPIKVLVAAKCDEPLKRVTAESGKELANDFEMEFFETSSKTGMNVSEVFKYLTQQIYNKKAAITKLEKGFSLSPPPPPAADGEKKSTKKKCC